MSKETGPSYGGVSTGPARAPAVATVSRGPIVASRIEGSHFISHVSLTRPKFSFANTSRITTIFRPTSSDRHLPNRNINLFKESKPLTLAPSIVEKRRDPTVLKGSMRLTAPLTTPDAGGRQSRGGESWRVLARPLALESTAETQPENKGSVAPERVLKVVEQKSQKFKEKAVAKALHRVEQKVKRLEKVDLSPKAEVTKPKTISQAKEVLTEVRQQTKLLTESKDQVPLRTSDQKIFSLVEYKTARVAKVVEALGKAQEVTKALPGGVVSLTEARLQSVVQTEAGIHQLTQALGEVQKLAEVPQPSPVVRVQTGELTHAEVSHQVGQMVKTYEALKVVGGEQVAQEMVMRAIETRAEDQESIEKNKQQFQAQIKGEEIACETIEGEEEAVEEVVNTQKTPEKEIVDYPTLMRRVFLLEQATKIVAETRQSKDEGIKGDLIAVLIPTEDEAPELQSEIVRGRAKDGSFGEMIEAVKKVSSKDVGVVTKRVTEIAFNNRPVARGPQTAEKAQDVEVRKVYYGRKDKKERLQKAA